MTQMTMTADNWLDNCPDEREDMILASVSDGTMTYYAYVPEDWDYCDVALAYAATADYDEFPVRLRVATCSGGDSIQCEMGEDRSVTLL